MASWLDGILAAFTPKPDYSPAQIAAALQTNFEGEQGVVRTWQPHDITYSIGCGALLDHSGQPLTMENLLHDEVWGLTSMTERQVAYAREAFEMWDDLIAINLNETSSDAANITLNYSSQTDNGGTYTEVVTAPTSPGVLSQTITGAHVWCSTDTANWPELQDASMAYANRGLEDFIHEIGHALGLSHAGPYDASDTITPTYLKNAIYSQDTQQYTVMSYFAPGSDGTPVDRLTDDGSAAFAATPLLDDILAIQAKYGADMTTRTGDTVYGFHSNANRAAFDFNINQAPVIAIWDAGGNDTLDCSGFGQNQNIDLNAGAFSDIGPLSKNVAIAYGVTIENAIGGGGDDTITGNAVDNQLEGGAGADKLDGRGGADVMIGGAGYDDYWVDTAPTWMRVGGGLFAHYAWVGGDQVIEQPNEGWDMVHASVSYTLPDNVEALALTGSADLAGYGNGLDNVLYGNDGNNRLEGYAGNDVLDGRGGADVMIGGAGDDTYCVDTTAVLVPVGGFWHSSPGDQVIENAGEGHDKVVANVSYSLPDNVEDLVLGQPGLTNPAIDGWGNALDNAITGNDAANKLYGLAGNDYIDGQGGDDVMVGGTGDDTYVVETGPHRELAFDGGFMRYEFLPGDQVVENAGEGHDTVIAAVTYTLPDNVEDLTLVGNAGLTAIGNALANVITGSAGGDVIDGRGGGDNLNGGDGADTITLHDGDLATGGSGNDLFDLGGFGMGAPYHAAITDLEAGDAIRWHFDTPVDGGELHLAGPLGAGTGEATGLDQVEMCTIDGHTTLYFGFDANPGADFVLSLDGGFDPAQLRLDDSQGATLTIDVIALARGGHDGFAVADGAPIDDAGPIDGGAPAGDAAPVEDLPSVDHVVPADDIVPVGDVAQDVIPADDAALPDQAPLEDAAAQPVAGDAAADPGVPDAASGVVADGAGDVGPIESTPVPDPVLPDNGPGDLITWDNAGTDVPAADPALPDDGAGDLIAWDNAGTDLPPADPVLPDNGAGDLITWDNAGTDLPAADPAAPAAPAADLPLAGDGGTDVPADNGAPPAAGPVDILPGDAPAQFNQVPAFHAWEMLHQSQWHLTL